MKNDTAMTNSNLLYDSSAQSDSKTEEQEERSLPPLASRGDINLWIDQDRNGNFYLRIDAPFLDSEPVFFHDDVKPSINQLVENWREKREGESS